MYPDNPASFYSGDPAVGPWQFDYTVGETGLYNYKCDIHSGGGMVGTMSVYDPLTYTDFPLAVLRLTDGVNGQHIFDGVPTRVSGVVHGINFQPSGYSFYIINEEGIGINVFSPDPGSYQVTEGDLVQVSGVIDQFNGLLEIRPDEILLLATGQPLSPAVSTTELTEDDEARHIEVIPYTVDSLVRTGTSGWNLYVTHESGTKVLIRVDADLGVDSAIVVNSTGVGGIGTQFDATFPYTSGYQVLALEFFPGTGITMLDQNAITLAPNPASTEITLTSNLAINLVEIYCLDGRKLSVMEVQSTAENIQVGGFLPGLYVIRAITDRGIWVSKFQKI